MVVQPRIKILPDGVVTSMGDEAAQLVLDAGGELDEWQRDVLRWGLGLRFDGQYAAQEVVLNCPRQNGKTWLVMARILLGLKRGENMAFTSHRSDAAEAVFADVVGLVRESTELEPMVDKIVFSNGREAITMKNGGKCSFGTRSTSRTGRGRSYDVVILDEAHYASEESLVALGFTGYARKKTPQRWFLASAVDREIHEHGMQMSRLRHRALSGEAKDLVYLEYSAGLFDENGDELEAPQVSPDMAADDNLIAEANPAIACGRVGIERALGERESLPHRGYVVERLGIGAYLDVNDGVGALITPQQWADLLDPLSKRGGEFELALDFSPERFCALVAAAPQDYDPGILHTELLKAGPGTGWVKDEVVSMWERLDVREVIIDGYPGNKGIIRELEEEGIPVRVLTGPEHAAACSHLLELVRARKFRHIGQPEMANALRGAQAKPLGDGLVWSRKNSPADSAAIVAMTVALWGAAEIDPNRKIEILY